MCKQVLLLFFFFCFILNTLDLCGVVKVFGIVSLYCSRLSYFNVTLLTYVLMLPCKTVTGCGGTVYCSRGGTGRPHPGSSGLVSGSDWSTHPRALQDSCPSQHLSTTAAVLHALWGLRGSPDQSISFLMICLLFLNVLVS